MLQILRQDAKRNGLTRLSILRMSIFYFTNPGFAVVVRYRLAVLFFPLGRFAKVVSKLFWLRNVHKAGCFLDPTSVIGPGLRLPHPVAIVIGGHARLGKNVTVYQQATIGRLNSGAAEVPQVGDSTIIYCGATLLGGIDITAGSVIGAHKMIRPEKS